MLSLVLLTVYFSTYALGQGQTTSSWRYPETDAWGPTCLPSDRQSPIDISETIIVASDPIFFSMWLPNDALHLVTAVAPFPVVHARPTSTLRLLTSVAVNEYYTLDSITVHSPAQHSFALPTETPVAELQLHFQPTEAFSTQRISIAMLVTNTVERTYERSILDTLMENWSTAGQSIVLEKELLAKVQPLRSYEYYGSETFPPCRPTLWIVAATPLRALKNVTDAIPSGTARAQVPVQGRKAIRRIMRGLAKVDPFAEFDVANTLIYTDNASLYFAPKEQEKVSSGYTGAVAVLGAATTVLLGLGAFLGTLEMSRYRKVAPAPTGGGDNFSNLQQGGQPGEGDANDEAGDEDEEVDEDGTDA